MNRRQLVQAVGGLVLAGSAELIVPVPRIWALGRWREPDYWADELDIRYPAQVTPAPCILARAEDARSVPSGWQEFPIIFEPLVPYGTMYLVSDLWMIEKLKEWRLGFEQARSAL